MSKNSGYAGRKDRPNLPLMGGPASHLTAGTHKTMKCQATTGARAALQDDVARKAMLKARKERRDARNA